MYSFAARKMKWDDRPTLISDAICADFAHALTSAIPRTDAAVRSQIDVFVLATGLICF